MVFKRVYTGELEMIGLQRTSTATIKAEAEGAGARITVYYDELSGEVWWRKIPAGQAVNNPILEKKMMFCFDTCRKMTMQEIADQVRKAYYKKHPLGEAGGESV
jgi:hypothetical protein